MELRRLPLSQNELPPAEAEFLGNDGRDLVLIRKGQHAQVH